MSNSQRLFSEAKQLLPGGVNSPVRSFSKVGGNRFSSKKRKDRFFSMKMVINLSTTSGLGGQ